MAKANKTQERVRIVKVNNQKLILADNKVV